MSLNHRDSLDSIVIMQSTLIALELNIYQKKFKKSQETKNIITNIYRIQKYDLMCGYFCMGFIDFMLKGKSLLDYKNLFSPNKYKKK